MKQILVISESRLFRDYLRLKLAENDVDMDTAINAREGISKIRLMDPDAVLIDYQSNGESAMDLLKQKKANLNIAKIPVILTAPPLEQRRIFELISYDVRKVFTKPVKIDAFFAALADILHTRFDIDQTPGILEVHVNESTIFIELAQGLNQDKLDLLPYKIGELVDLYAINSPKILVMISDTQFGSADVPKMRDFFSTLIETPRVQHSRIRIITRDPFVKDFIEGNDDYAHIAVVPTLQEALDGFLGEPGTAGEGQGVDGDKFLVVKEDRKTEFMQFRFSTDEEKQAMSMEDIQESMRNVRIAAVDDDFIIQELIKTTFQRNGAVVNTYGDGNEYLAALDTEQFDLVFLDLVMPQMNGFRVLQALRDRQIRQRVIVLSAIPSREAVLQAFRMGVKSYLIKPLNADAIFKKSLEILKTHF